MLEYVILECVLCQDMYHAITCITIGHVSCKNMYHIRTCIMLEHVLQ